MVQGKFREGLGKVKERFMEGSDMVQGWFRGDSGKGRFLNPFETFLLSISQCLF